MSDLSSAKKEECLNELKAILNASFDSEITESKKDRLQSLLEEHAFARAYYREAMRSIT